MNFITFIIAASTASTANAFAFTNYKFFEANFLSTNQLNNHDPTSLYAKPNSKAKRRTNTNGSINKGFGKTQQSIDIIDKSYGQSILPQTMEETQEAMNAFFTTHNTYHPLFREIMSEQSTAAISNHILNDNHDTTFINTWSSTQYPWSILPPKPSSNSSLSLLSNFLDEWQNSLTSIPMDAFKNVPNGYDRHFLEEGRRTIAVTRFHCIDDNPGSEEEESCWEDQLFRMAWSEIGYLTDKNEEDTGSLILLPEGLNGGNGGESHLEHVQKFVEEKLVRPVEWLGRGEDWEIVAMERGSVGVRLLYRLGEIPDLSEKYQMED